MRRNRVIVIVVAVIVILALAATRLSVRGGHERSQAPAAPTSTAPERVVDADAVNVADVATDSGEVRGPPATVPPRAHPAGRAEPISLVMAWSRDRPAAVRGDGEAALNLFAVLDWCSRHYAPGVPDDAAIRRCAGADPRWYDTALDWLTQAADSGSPPAMILWAKRAARYLPDDDPATIEWFDSKSRLYLEAARDRGLPEAMMMISERDLESDPVNAIAHLSLAIRVVERFRGLEDVLQLPEVDDLRVRLAALESRLDADQRAIADTRAVELFQRCCMR